MAIRIPGLMEEIQPGIAGLTEGIKLLVNPQYKQQQALRDAMMKNPEMAQMLADMGPEKVEQMYGKGTSKITPNLPRSLNAELSDQARELLALPVGDSRREEFISGKLGTQTSAQRKQQGLNAKKTEQDLTQGEQQITAGELAIQDRRSAQQRERDARTTVQSVLLKVGGRGNLYKAAANNQLTPEEMAAVQAVPEYKEVFEFQRDDFWKNSEMQFRREVEDRLRAGDPDATNIDKIMTQQDAMLARKYADQSQMSNARDIYDVLRDKELYNMYKGKPQPKEGRDLALWTAVQAVDNARARTTSEEVRTAREDFRRTVAPLLAKLNSPVALKKSGLTRPEDVQQLVDQYNAASVAILRPVLGDDAPQIAYSKEGKNSVRNNLPDVNTVHLVKGSDPEFTDNTSADADDPVIEQMVRDALADNKVYVATMASPSMPKDKKAKFERRYKALSKVK